MDGQDWTVALDAGWHCDEFVVGFKVGYDDGCGWLCTARIQQWLWVASVAVDGNVMSSW